MPKLKTVYLVSDHTDYSSDTVIAGFTDKEEAIKYADTEPLHTDGRSVTELILNCASSVPTMFHHKRRG